MFQLLDVWILALTSLAVFFDISFRKIPNWLTLFGLAGGLILNALEGLDHLYGSLLGFSLGIGLFFLPFAAGWLGAGDVKYFAVVGSLIGFRLLPRVLFYSILTGGLLAIISLVNQNRRLDAAKIRNAWLDYRLAALTLGRIRPEKSSRATASATIPWGVAIGAGTIFAYYVDARGYWAGF